MYEEYKYIVSLKEASKQDPDKNTGAVEYLLEEGEEEVISLDSVKDYVGNIYRKKKPPTSCDAFVVKNGRYYLIEFKNRIRQHVSDKGLFYKAYDSVFLIQCMFARDKSLEDLASRTTYVVVYNDKKKLQKENEISKGENFLGIKQKMGDISNYPNYKEKIFWGLDVFKGTFFKDVYTVDKEIFEKKLKPQIFGDYDGVGDNELSVLEQVACTLKG